MNLVRNVLASLAFSATVIAGELVEKKPVVPEEDHWKFTLAVPGWMPGIEGTVGIDGIDSDIDVSFKDYINKVDMIWATRGEASKGRFGILGELIYLSMSNSVGIGGPLRNIDIRGDQYLADFSVRWRLVEGERGYVDVLAGVRYTNIYQSLHLQSDDDGVGEASAGLVDSIGDALSDRIRGVTSEEDFRNALLGALEENIIGDLQDVLGADGRHRELVLGPLGARHPLATALIIQDIVNEEESRLKKEIRALLRRGETREAEIRGRINAAKARMQDRIADALDSTLNRSFARCDDWWDPYVGVRARYNFTPSIYFTLRGDIGGFGVGSDLMWQVEGAFGLQLTRSIYAEAGYRALSFDYDKDGLTYDTITHGVQVTVGVQF